MAAAAKRVNRGGAGHGLKGIREDEEGATETDRVEEEQWQAGRTLIKPEDQLQLTDSELKEEFTRILTANNPHAPQNIVRYSFKERQYKPASTVDQLAIHFHMEGNLIHKDSDEAKRQLAVKSRLSAVPEGGSTSQNQNLLHMGIDSPINGTLEEDLTGASVHPVGPNAEIAPSEGEPDIFVYDGFFQDSTESTGEKKLTNQFNFTERAAQTYNNPYRDRSTVTEPPPRATFSGNVTQWEIYDAYLEDQEKNQDKTKEKRTTKKDDEKKKRNVVYDMQGDDISKVANAAKILERMVNQNTFDDVAQDFKYWEDLSDEHRGEEGTLLPLWKFHYEPAKKLAVTSLCWNPKYADFFAVSFGSYEFLKQSSGMILLYSLKNPSFPEFTFETESGVMSIDLHTQSTHMLCCGFYDGNVAVYNLLECARNGKKTPAYMSSARVNKHTDPVWQVKWQKNDLDGNMNFMSVSSDGRLLLWTTIKNELLCSEVTKLNMTPGMTVSEKRAAMKLGAPTPSAVTTTPGTPSGENAQSKPTSAAGSQQLATTNAKAPQIAAPMYACGTTFDFHKQMDYLFVVGTEEGQVFKCSKAYTSQFLDTYNAHSMVIYQIKWNTFHSRVFATCSADWTVKIWDHTMKDPVFTFDLGSPVGDVAWSPYSSTVFAAVTADGKAYVWDLNINKYEPICEQAVISKKKAKLTHVSFNPFEPILIVGDDRGNVISMKLSPNLRKQPKEKKGATAAEKHGPQQEIEKLEKLIQLVKETPKNAAQGASSDAAKTDATKKDKKDDKE